jgi:hypothetical protein
MRRSHIPQYIVINAPLVHAGTYITYNSLSHNLYSWYLNGKSTLPKPHFSVGSNDDAQPSGEPQTRWFQFHISIPMVTSSGTGVNAHIWYTFDRNRIVTRSGDNSKDRRIRDEYRQLVQAEVKNKEVMMIYDQLAQAFVTAAHA